MVQKKRKVKKAGGGMLAKEFRPTGGDLAEAGARALKILGILKQAHPDARIALKYGNPLELLVATVLSAQCTDVRVNIVSQRLFKKYRRAGNYVAVDQDELEDDIRSTGFFRNKAKNIKAACKDIVEKFGGEVPGNMVDLLSLAGVGRKTANVILGNAFGVPGVVTDTHVIRLSRLMGLSDQEDPVKLEYALMELIPKKDWTFFSHLMIFHGRRICMARKPDCGGCAVRESCAFFKVVSS